MSISTVLNTCAGNFQSYSSYYDERDCGCFLFAKDTLTYFVGSAIGYCVWGTFGLVLSLLFCFIFGCYHVYRVCCKTQKPRSGKMEVRQRSTEIMQLTIEQELQEADDISPYYWTPATIIASIMVIYCFVHSVMLTDGFFSTCKQYRNRVIKHTLAKGEMVSHTHSHDIKIDDSSFLRRSVFCSRDYHAVQFLTLWIISRKTCPSKDVGTTESTLQFHSFFQ